MAGHKKQVNQHVERVITPYFSVTEGDILETKVSNIAYGANTVSFVKTNSTMRRFSKHFSGLSKDYRKACLDGRMNVGRALLHYSQQRKVNVFVLGVQSFPGPFARLKHVEASLAQALHIVRSDELLEKELAIPAIGCGSGGLRWVEVEPVVRKLAEKYKVKVVAYIA